MSVPALSPSHVLSKWVPSCNPPNEVSCACLIELPCSLGPAFELFSPSFAEEFIPVHPSELPSNVTSFPDLPYSVKSSYYSLSKLCSPHFHSL